MSILLKRLRLKILNVLRTLKLRDLVELILNDKIFTRKLDTNQLKYELTHNGEFRG